MNDELKEQAKARVQEALRVTQEQSKEAAVILGALFRVGAKKLKEVAEKTAEAVREDIASRR